MSAPIEMWLRGPIAGVAPVLMPAAHALLQTYEDIERAVTDLSRDELWVEPGGASSIGFHLRHLVGSTDRLFTYARGERLSETQRAHLASEKTPGDVPPDAATLVADLKRTIDTAVDRLRQTPLDNLYDTQTVGRTAASTRFGLLFHAAEHAQRHAGQVVTTAKILRSQRHG